MSRKAYYKSIKLPNSTVLQDYLPALQLPGIQIRLHARKVLLDADTEQDLVSAEELVQFALQRVLKGQTLSPKVVRSHMQRSRPQGTKSHPAVSPKTPGQAQYLEAIDQHDIIFGLGPAGTGKTFIAVSCAVQAFQQGRVQRIILTRPAIEAGERLGFLPGTFAEKVHPYLQPLFDGLHCFLGKAATEAFQKKGLIEIAPLAYMRGRTLEDAFIILDEAQNCTWPQLVMLLTRLGHGSKCIVTGDLSQSDLRPGTEGLSHIARALGNVEGIHVHTFTGDDVVRHPLVGRILKAVEDYQKESLGF